MKLFINRQYDQLCNNGLDQNQGKNHYPVVKLILPGTGCAWLLTEIRPQQDYKYAYGLADYGYGSCYNGYINLEALCAMSDPICNNPVIQDYNFKSKYPVAVYLDAANANGYITDEDYHLIEAAQRLTRQHSEQSRAQLSFRHPRALKP